MPEMSSGECFAAEICLLQGDLTIGVDIFDQMGYNHNRVGLYNNTAEVWSDSNNHRMAKG